MPRESAKKGVLGRVLRTLFESYPVLAPVVAFGLVFSSVVSSIPALFQQRIIAIVEIYVDSGDWSAAKAEIMPLIVTLIVLYFFSISLMIAGQLILAYMTQGYLCKMRRKMFEHMQDLPIRYFDSHRAGDVMSYYTNDIDTLRQLVSQALPQIVRSGAILATILGIMIWYCGWLTILILLGVCAMIFVTKIFGGGSARYFKRQQQTMGKTEGYIQEMMNGQKVVKVFCREKESMAAFEKINGELCEDSFRANAAIKAAAAARYAGLIALADDSGLAVDALSGAPGIYSARYAGTGDDADNRRKLLQALSGVEEARRAGAFVCQACLAFPADDGEVGLWFGEGRCEGRIAFAEKGENGFGYDSLFYLPEHGCTMAELDPEKKNRLSHRFRAMSKAAAFLSRFGREL